MRQTPKSKKKSRGGLCAVILVIAFIGLVASIFSGHGSASTTTATSTATSAPVLAASTPTQATTAQPAVKATAVSKATPKPQPTHQATPRPTPRPTQLPTCQAINNNPWCDNFSPGNLIYNPPSNFCDYFNCIASFWGSDDPGDGYVVQCADSTYSQSGGERGACSSHGGVSRPLYSH